MEQKVQSPQTLSGPTWAQPPPLSASLEWYLSDEGGTDRRGRSAIAQSPQFAAGFTLGIVVIASYGVALLL